MSEDTDNAIYDVRDELQNIRKEIETHHEINDDPFRDRTRRRDLFAAAALTGILANPKTTISLEDGVIMRTCFEFAEQMLAESEQQSNNDPG